jgi:hypothetical protein
MMEHTHISFPVRLSLILTLTSSYITCLLVDVQDSAGKCVKLRNGRWAQTRDSEFIETTKSAVQ